jgi:hypothetical protein
VVALGTFNPRTSAEQLAFAPKRLRTLGHVEPPETYFLGRWDQLNPLNVPGPFYGAETDTCCDGPPLAPYSLLTDENASGFVWRQPRNDTETRSLMAGCSSDPFSGFGWDGDQHWTPDLVRRWWSERGNRTQLVTAAVREVSRYDEYPENIATSYLAYLSGDDIVRDLRRYLFFLSEGRYPGEEQDLLEL